MTPALRYATVDSPIGELLLLGDGRALHGLWMQGDGSLTGFGGGIERKHLLLALEHDRAAPRLL